MLLWRSHALRQIPKPGYPSRLVTNILPIIPQLYYLQSQSRQESLRCLIAEPIFSMMKRYRAACWACGLLQDVCVTRNPESVIGSMISVISKCRLALPSHLRGPLRASLLRNSMGP